jgi:hypothetical protein
LLELDEIRLLAQVQAREVFGLVAATPAQQGEQKCRGEAGVLAGGGPAQRAQSWK